MNSKKIGEIHATVALLRPALSEVFVEIYKDSPHAGCLRPIAIADRHLEQVVAALSEALKAMSPDKEEVTQEEESEFLLGLNSGTDS